MKETLRGARSLPEVLDEATDEVELRLARRASHVLRVRIQELEPPASRIEVGRTLVDAQDEPAGVGWRACGRLRQPADIDALGTTLEENVAMIEDIIESLDVIRY